MNRSTIERLRDARAFAQSSETRVLGLECDTFRQVDEVKYTVYYLPDRPRRGAEGSSPGCARVRAEHSLASIIGMRNRLIHTYWRIDDEIVYDVATLELPTLTQTLERMIKRLTEE